LDSTEIVKQVVIILGEKMYRTDDTKEILVNIGGTPNPDILYEYFAEWTGSEYQSNCCFIQSFKIGAVGPSQTIKLTRIRIRGYANDPTTIGNVIIDLHGYYPNGPNGLPWPVPPLPAPMASATIQNIPAQGDFFGDWMDATFTGDIILQPNLTYSFFGEVPNATSENKLNLNVNFGGDRYPGGKHFIYLLDNPQGNTPYYQFDGKRDIAFQIYGTPVV